MKRRSKDRPDGKTCNPLECDAMIGMVVEDTIEGCRKSSIADGIHWLEEHGFHEECINGRIHYINKMFEFKNVPIELTCYPECTAYNLEGVPDVEVKWVCNCGDMQLSNAYNTMYVLVDDIFIRNKVKVKSGLMERWCLEYSPFESRAQMLKIHFAKWMTSCESVSTGCVEDSVRDWCMQLANALEMIENQIKSHPSKFWSKDYLAE